MKIDYANIVDKNNTCNHMSQTGGGDEELKYPAVFSLLDPNKPFLGLRLAYTGGDRCTKTR